MNVYMMLSVNYIRNWCIWNIM